MKKHRLSFKTLWRPVGLVILGTVAALAAYLYHLVLLAPNLSPSERTMDAASGDWHHIIADPTHPLLKTLHWLMHFAPAGHAILFARLPSVLLALVALALFTYLLHRWYGQRSMLFGFFIFLCSAWCLHVGRFAGVDIEYMLGILALLTIHVGLTDLEDNVWMFFGWLAVNVILLFTPGMVWFVLLGAALQPRVLFAAWKNAAAIWQRALWLFIALLGIAVPAYAIARNHALLWSWLGLPSHLPVWRNLPAQFGHTFEALVYHAPNNPELWLGNLPLLDIFLFAMFLAGIVFYAKHWQAARTRLLAGFFLLAVVLISINLHLSFSLLIPVVYVVVVAGIAYVLHFWLKVFPRNPVARVFGIVLVSAVLVTSGTYSLWQYFVAWPHNPDTHSVYSRSEH